MSHWTCPRPPMPDNVELIESFEHRIYPLTLTGWGHYFMGLGTLEEIEDLGTCPAGNTLPNRASLSKARHCFRTAREHLQKALNLWFEFRASLPEPARKMLSPNIKMFYDMTSLLEEAEAAIAAGGIPTLECTHRISELIREDIVFGERMGRVNRGVQGHSPYPEDELVEIMDSTVNLTTRM